MPTQLYLNTKGFEALGLKLSKPLGTSKFIVLPITYTAGFPQVLPVLSTGLPASELCLKMHSQKNKTFINHAFLQVWSCSALSERERRKEQEEIYDKLV